MKPLVVALFGSVIFVLWMGYSSSGKLLGKLNWKQRSHSKGVRQNVIKKQSITSPNYLSKTDNGPAGMTNVKKPGGTLAAAVGDGTSDDTSAIQAIINHAARTGHNQKVFFPPGEYLVSRDIVIPGSVEIRGTESGIAIIKASIPYAKKIYNASPVNAVALKHLWLDGIRVEFDGGAHGTSSTNDIAVFNCVFFSRASPTVTNAKKQQLKLAHLTNGNVERCVFLRDSSAFGVASTFSKTKRVSFKKNVCGLALSKVDWLSELEPARVWLVQKKKLGFLKTHYHLADDQGFFKSCLYDQCDEEMRISENVFNGSPNTGSLHKDHVVYLKGFKTMIFESNYARGWPAHPSGGIKARNGKNLWLARNYIDGTGILMYTHKKTKACLNDGFENVVIYGNHIVQRSKYYGHRASGISYNEPHFTGRDENVKYSANEFEFNGVSDPTIYQCIWLTNADLSHHHVYQDNVYYGTTTKVKLQARHSTPSFQTGSISKKIKDRFNYRPYKLNVSIY